VSNRKQRDKNRTTARQLVIKNSLNNVANYYGLGVVLRSDTPMPFMLSPTVYEMLASRDLITRDNPMYAKTKELPLLIDVDPRDFYARGRQTEKPFGGGFTDEDEINQEEVVEKLYKPLIP